jgi:cytohesin
LKQLLITIAALVLVGCGESQESAPSSEATPVEPVAKAATPEPQTAKAPDISIHRAAEEGNLEAVKQHLAAGTDVDAKAAGGSTPLHEATVQDQKEIVELLIDKGADVNAKNDYGETPLDWTDVDDVDSKEIADLLRKHGGKSGAEFSIHFAAGDDNIEAIKQHLAAGTDVNAKNISGQTPLHCSWTKEVTELLIAKGADINAKNEIGETPLDTAKKT